MKHPVEMSSNSLSVELRGEALEGDLCWGELDL